MSKWIRHLAVPIAVLALVAAACSKKTATSSGAPACTSTLKVGLSLDVGGIGDKSFNDAANRGLNKAITDGLVCQSNTKLIESNSTGSNRDNNTAALASAGYNLVVATGFAFTPGVAGSPTSGPGTASLYPDVNFAVIDGYATCGTACGLNAPTANIADLDFKEQEGSYLVGIAAAMQAQKDGSNTVGFLGGQSGQGLIEKFQAGYTAGVHSVDPTMKVLVEYIGTDVTAFNDPTKGKTLSVKMYGEGADVIYHAAGGSGSAAEQRATNAPNESRRMTCRPNEIIPGVFRAEPVAPRRCFSIQRRSNDHPRFAGRSRPRRSRLHPCARGRDLPRSLCHPANNRPPDVDRVLP
jgi:basic membrane protein A